MSIERDDDQDKFKIILLGNESKKIKLNNKFENIDKLKEYLNDKKDSSVIVILSNEISNDILSSIDFPQICAVYNDKLVCLSPLISSVDKYLKENSKRVYLSYFLSFLQKHWFLIGLVISIILAYLFPNVGKTGGYIRSEWSIKIGGIVLVFFLNGLSVQTRDFAKEFLHIRLHLFVQMFSLLIIPFTIYGLGILLSKFSINKILIVGIIIIGSTSTTISSNFIMTKNAMGNDCAALLNAILGNILGIFISPGLLFYFMKNPMFNLLLNTNIKGKQLNYKRIITNLSLTVLIPFFLGQIIHLLWTKQVKYIRKKFYLSELNSLTLLALLWSVYCTAFATGSFDKIEIKDFFIVIGINTGIYISFSIIILIVARLPIPYWQFSKQDTIAITFCGTMKSLAMGISLINAFYQYENQDIIGLVSLPFTFYHVQQLMFGAIEVILLKKWVQNEFNKQSSTENDLQMNEQETMNINS